jgi:hypothetical protein
MMFHMSRRVKLYGAHAALSRKIAAASVHFHDSRRMPRCGGNFAIARAYDGAVVQTELSP